MTHCKNTACNYKNNPYSKFPDWQIPDFEERNFVNPPNYNIM
jgi:hypothetical protein